LLALTAHAATDVAGVRFADTEQIAGQSLVLNGAGLRKKLFFKVYAAGLYLERKAGATEAVLAQSGPRRIAIVTLRDLTAAQFTDALREGLEKNLAPAELEALKPAIDAFSTALLSIKDAKEGTRIDIDFQPAGGTQLVVAGRNVGEPIAGKAFADALLRVWIGSQPAQDDLKRALLGQ
jgi:hypothetical protein